MATDDRTPIQNFPRPNTANTVAEDFSRIITLVNMLETKISAHDGQIVGKAETGHTHPISGVDGLQSALNAKKDASWRPALGDLSDVTVAGAANGQFLGLIGTAWQPVTLSVSWLNVSGKPNAFPTTWGDVSGKPTTYPPDTHSHPITQVTGLQTALNNRLPSAGGTLTGQLTIFAPYAGIFLNKTGNGEGAFIRGDLNGSPRWQIQFGDGAQETGNNTGSNFSIERVLDNGTSSQVIGISRNDGTVYMPAGCLAITGQNSRIILKRSAENQSNAIYGQRSDGTVAWSLELGNHSENNFGIGRHRADGLWLGNPIRVQADGTTHIGTPGTSTFMNAAPYVLRGGPGDRGGVVQLQAPTTSTSIVNDVTIDVFQNLLRIFETGGSARGAYLSIPQLAGGAGSELIHSHNVRSWIANGDTQDLGKYIFAYYNGGTVNFGQTVTGNFLFPASHSSWQGSSVNGTWRCQGYAPTGQMTLWQRIA